MLRQILLDQMKQAMRLRQAEKLSVIRFIVSAIRNVEIDAKHELDDDAIIKLIRQEVKRRREAIDQYRAGGRDDIVVKELAELAIIETFLPAQMPIEAIERIIIDIIAQNPQSDFGQLMKLSMAATKGQADGKLVSDMVRQKMTSN